MGGAGIGGGVRQADAVALDFQGLFESNYVAPFQIGGGTAGRRVPSPRMLGRRPRTTPWGGVHGRL